MVEVDGNKVSVLILCCVDELLANVAALSLDAHNSSFVQNILNRLVTCHNHCKEKTVSAVNSYHSVRC